MSGSPTMVDIGKRSHHRSVAEAFADHGGAAFLVVPLRIGIPAQSHRSKIFAHDVDQAPISFIAPRSSQTAVSQRFLTATMSCETNRMVFPSCFIWRIFACSAVESTRLPRRAPHRPAESRDRVNRYRKCQPDVHAAGVCLHWLIDETTNFGEPLDFGNLANCLLPTQSQMDALRKTFSLPVNSGLNPAPSSSKAATRPFKLTFPSVGCTVPRSFAAMYSFPEPFSPMTPNVLPFQPGN